ncbi:MAG: hypothetical protein V1928_00850 [Parcubacteria group bacterium]
MKNRSNAVLTNPTQAMPLVRAANLWAGGNLTEDDIRLTMQVCREMRGKEPKGSLAQLMAIKKLRDEHDFPSAKASAAVKKFFFSD